eukprot:jgi/Mesvir1/22401/Mv17889-RA.1
MSKVTHLCGRPGLPVRSKASCWAAIYVLFATAAFVHISVNAEKALRGDRSDAFVGYSEIITSCVDQQELCATWAEMGECTKNPTFMSVSCRKSCRLCSKEGAAEAVASLKHAGATQVLMLAAPQGPAWEGYATPDGTDAFALPFVTSSRAGIGHFHSDPCTVPRRGLIGPLVLSSVGVGTYLGPSDRRTDDLVAAAVVDSVLAGVNVIDSAISYRDMGGERSVGAALRRLRDEHSIRREGLFLSTKSGYIPGDGRQSKSVASVLATMQAEMAEAGHRPLTSDSLVDNIHCIAPGCIEWSLGQSLANLGVATLDLLYLHNAAEAQVPVIGRPKFLANLRAAFEQLEAERRRGRLRFYGLATWSSLRVPPGDAEHLSLQDVVDLAVAVAGTDHGFKFVQLPINAAMLEAWNQPWQAFRPPGASEAKMDTLLEVAARLGVGVFASGPLQEGSLPSTSKASAIARAPELGGVVGDVPKLLQFVRSTPKLLSVLVGHKTPEHVKENLELVSVPPLTHRQFADVVAQLPR